MIAGLLWATVVVLLALGLVGVFLPLVPGPALILAAALLYGLAQGFDSVTPAILAVLTVITVLTYAIDFLASAVGAERAGASRWGVAGSLVGTVAGLLMFSLPGMLIGLFLGAMVCEVAFGGKNVRAALRSGWGSLLGMLGGVVAKFVLALAMIVIFLWSALS